MREIMKNRLHDFTFYFIVADYYDGVVAENAALLIGENYVLFLSGYTGLRPAYLLYDR